MGVTILIHLEVADEHRTTSQTLSLPAGASPMTGAFVRRKGGKVIWKREDLGPDGAHPSMLGRENVARLLMDFLKTDQTSRAWFLKNR